MKELVHAILDQYALPWYGTHGVSHWARVLENGRRLVAETGAVLEVVELFALFHDARRSNEGFDPGHGQRGAEYAATLRNGLFRLPQAWFDLLFTACVAHTNGSVEGDITVRTCWDADRLDLGRVGFVIDPQRLGTQAARDPQVITWASQRARARVVPDLVRSEWALG